MGVKLTDIIPKEEISWESLSKKVLVLDASNVLFQFLSSIRQQDGNLLTDKEGNVTSHLVGLFSRTANLMEKGIKPAFVFDGKAPELKREERERRQAVKEKAAERYEAAKGERDEAAMLKYSRQTSHLTKEMVDDAKKLIKAFGLPIIQAPSEAEAQAAFICRKGKAFAVASQDYDSLLFGAPRLIQNLALAEKRKLPNGSYVKVVPQMIELSKALEAVGIDQDQLIVLSILIGTDFNPGGIKGIGPKTALKLVRSNKPFETIFKEAEADFDWKEIFELFKSMPTTEDFSMEFHGVDEEAVRKILVDAHDFSEERVASTLGKLRESRTKGQTSLAAFG